MTVSNLANINTLAMKPLYVMALACALTSCQQADDLGTPQLYPEAVQSAVGSLELSRTPGLPMDTLVERVNVADDAMLDVAHRAKTWQEADHIAQRHIESARPGVVREAVEQSVAKAVLVGYLVPARGEPGASEAALRYARLLVDRRSPEAEAVLAAVQTFGAEWPAQERRAIALGAADAAVAHVTAGTTCRDCEAPADVRQALADAGRAKDVVTARRIGAAAALREQAQ